MSDATPISPQERLAYIRALLGNPLLQEVVLGTEREAIERWRRATTLDEREDAFVQLKAVELFAERLLGLKGELAAAEHANRR
jgi:hypothetical protein